MVRQQEIETTGVPAPETASARTLTHQRLRALVDTGPDTFANPLSLRARLARTLVIALLGSGPLAGCASVAPYEKEHLADTILALDAEAAEEAREVKWLEAREGSTGGVGGAGGGCACN